MFWQETSLLEQNLLGRRFERQAGDRIPEQLADRKDKHTEGFQGPFICRPRGFHIRQSFLRSFYGNLYQPKITQAASSRGLCRWILVQ